MGGNYTLNTRITTILSSICIGLVVSFTIIYFIEAIGHALYPLPKNLSANLLDDIEILKTYIAGVPTEGMFFPLVSYFLGCTFGGLLAFRISNKIYPALIIGAVILIINLLTLKLIPHPFWYVITSNVIPLPSALFGAHLSKNNIFTPSLSD